ncbi:hypothetical protein UFOVP787_127 [uncultured Caudovirales phage]|uniref:Uncharacterized protein n=1 Tax=uncultured Caudovirales phage TaxID=2100421 RepID=A0A6J5NVK1_9CAUD|nr:hypothetical protein UFOVP787_127 [uncultured Caudovirales phage]
MDSSQQSDYTILVVQSQEKILLDFLRKTIDLEARHSLLSSQHEQLKKLYEETVLQNENSIELFNQAKVSLESLTIQNKNYESQIENFHKIIAEKDKNYSELINIKNLHESKHNEYKRECERLQKETQQIYDQSKIFENEFKILKQKEEVVYTTEPKNKKKQTLKKVSEDDF